MASGANRDVTLGVGIKTTGEETLRSLAQEVRNLAKSGGDAAPAFDQLADELTRLSAQAGKLEAFKQLADDVEALTAAQKEAKAASDGFEESLREQQSIAKQLADAQDKAKQAVREAASELKGAQLAVEKLAAETSKAEKATESYQVQMRGLKVAVVDAKSSLNEKKDALQTAKDAAEAAARAERDLAQEFERTDRAVDKVTRSLNEQQQAMSAAGTSAEALGVDLTDVAKAEDLILTTQQRIAQDAAFTKQNESARVFAAGVAAAAAEVDRLADQAAKLNKADEYTRFWRQELERLEAEAKQSADAVARLTRESISANDALKSAFGTTGVRSIAAIDAEISNVERSMSLLERKFKAGAISADDLARATSSAAVRIATLKREIDTVPSVQGKFEQMSSAIQGIVSRFGALGAAVATLSVAVRPVVEATVELDQMRRVLTSVTGSAEAAAKQIEFVRDVAQRSGQSFSAVSESFSKFAASALNSGLSMDTVRNVFERTSMAAGNLGLSADATKGILEALGQMASKGVISMEELRGQLGDRLPGALSLMAKGLGLTEQQLNKLVESGQLLSKDALPALAEAMVALGPKGTGPVEGIIASWNRFKNVITETTTILTDGPLGRAAGVVLGALGSAVEHVAFGVAMIGESFNVVGKQIGTVVAAVVNRDFKNLGQALADIEKESNDKLASLAGRIDGTGSAAAGAAPHVATLSSQVQAATDAIASGNPALEQQAAHLKATGAAAEVTTKSWVQLQAAAAEAIKIAEKEAITADTLAKAKKLEGDARAAVIALSGDEIAAKNAVVQAANEYTAALEQQAVADEKVAALARKQVDELKAKAAETKRDDEATKKHIETLDRAAQGKEADAKKTRDQADAARANALALGIQADALKDTSAEVEKYRKAVADAEQALVNVRVAMIAGAATQADERRALEALAAAQGMYRNALNDTVKAIEANSKAKNADRELNIASLTLSAELAREDGARARRMGDEFGVRQALIKQKEIELQIEKLKIDQQKIEANGSLAIAEAKRAEMLASGQLTEVAKVELDTAIKLAQAKLKVLEAQGLNVKAREDELARIKSGVDALDSETNSRNKNTGSIDTNRRARDGSISTIERETRALENLNATAGRIGPSTDKALPKGVTVDEVKNDPYGRSAEEIGRLKQQGGPVDASYVFTLRDRLERGESFSPDELPAIRNALRVAQENSRLGNAGSVSVEGRRDNDMWVNILRRIVEQTEGAAGGVGFGQSQGNVGFGQSRGNVGFGQSQASSGNGTAAGTPIVGTRTVNINLGGTSTSVNVASDADADRLENMLRQLAASASRATT